MTLYNITDEHRNLLALIEESGGEITPEIEDAFKINATELQQKSEGYAYIIKHLEDRQAVVDQEIKRLKEIKDRDEKKLDYLKERIVGAMVEFGIKKIETPLLTLSLRQSNSVDVQDENLIPPEYKEKVITYKVSKTLLKQALIDGVEILGVHLVTKENLQIK